MRAAIATMGTRSSPPLPTDTAEHKPAVRDDVDETPDPRPAWRRPELLLPLAALAAGLLLLPLLIWLAGTRVLGAYTRASEGPAAGPLGLYADYYSALAHGVPAFWAAALGPLALVLLGRALLRLLRGPA